MFTIQKAKLFVNDPKFSQIRVWDADSQQASVNKIYAGQQQLRRSKVIKKTIQNSSKQGLPADLLLLDFLQSRMDSFQNKLVKDVQETFYQKQRIKDKYNEAEQLYEKANRKLKRLMINVKTEKVSFQNIDQVQKEVTQIQQLYEENQFLKHRNNEIKLRIEKKQLQLESIRK